MPHHVTRTDLTFRQRLTMRTFTAVQRPLMAGLRLLDDPVGHLSDVDGMVRDPYGLYRRIAAHGPVATSRIRAMAVATGHAAVRQILREHRVEPPNPMFAWDSPVNPSLLSLDAPDHTRIRTLVTAAFTPRVVARMRRRAGQVAGRLLDKAARVDAPIDLMRDYASPLPITMICALMGLPADDLDRYRDWGESVALSLEVPDPAVKPRIDRAAHELEHAFSAEFERRRHAPGDDLVSALVQARDGEDRLSDRELVATCILILLAGFETTVNLIGNGTLALLCYPEQREALAADPAALAGPATEELLRFDSPVQMTSRFTSRPTLIAGTELDEGVNVVCLLGAANRDPAVFADPDTLDLTRPNAREHLAFSAGAHYCLGASLARLEGEVALATLFGRYPKLSQTAPARRRRAQVLRGLETFPVRLGPPA